MEIEHVRYDGKKAPPFPPSFQNDPKLKPYLEPDRFIEAADPVLVKKAREISAGAGDSWQAAVRLSRWVAENIGYAIPGGGSARKTFDIRAGECGAHSMLLAAFCRAVGIPARVVFGAMYAPNFGGGFGQHAWNEIYMGAAGWIPVDATAFETDFVDSGHIRITELQSAAANAFNGRKIMVLDYRLGDTGMRPSLRRSLRPTWASSPTLRAAGPSPCSKRKGTWPSMSPVEWYCPSTEPTKRAGGSARSPRICTWCSTGMKREP